VSGHQTGNTRQLQGTQIDEIYSLRGAVELLYLCWEEGKEGGANRMIGEDSGGRMSKAGGQNAGGQN
jgi:hypothetical protein